MVTLGLGGEFSARINPRAGERGTLDLFNALLTTDESDIDYDGTQKVGGLGGLVHFYPSKGPHRAGFLFDPGAEFQGSPRVSIASSAGQVFLSDLDKEASKIEEDTKVIQYWPVVAAGISLRL